MARRPRHGTDGVSGRWAGFVLGALWVGLSIASGAVAAPENAPSPGDGKAAGAGHGLAAGGPFSASPDALRRAAGQRLPSVIRSGGAPVVVLWRDESLVFDAQGRARRTRHWIYRIDSTVALESWGQSEMAWSPWFEETPRLRARVVTADGDEHWLDAEATIRRAAEGRHRGSVAADRRVVRLPLPQVAVGSVVEEELVIQEHRAPFLSTRHGRLALALPVPLVRGRLRFETPPAWPLNFAGSLLGDIEPRRRAHAEVKGESPRETTVYEYGPLRAAAIPEPGLLPQDARFPTVSFSSGAQWGPVAQALHSVVEPLIQGDIDSPSEVPRRTQTDADRVGELLTALHRRVETVDGGGPALAAEPPQRPRKTLSSGRGDGLDLALALVAWLRAEGIPSFVALAAGGPAQDLHPEQPGEQLLDRPLVYVPGADPIWVDIGNPWARAGEIDPQLSGRWALVLSADSRQLVRLPWAQADDHRTLTTVEIHLAEEGPARILETNELTGFSAQAQRRLLAGLDPDQRRQAYLAYVQSAYHAPHLGVVDDTESDNLVVSYRLRLEALDAERAFTAGDEAAVAISRRDLVTGLSPELLTTPRGSRHGDYFFSRPQEVVWRYRIHLPDGMVPRQLPADEERSLGSGMLRQHMRFRDGLVEAEFSFNSGPIFLSARQFEVYRQAVSEILQEETLVLWFERSAAP